MFAVDGDALLTPKIVRSTARVIINTFIRQHLHLALNNHVRRLFISHGVIINKARKCIYMYIPIYNIMENIQRASALQYIFSILFKTFDSCVYVTEVSFHWFLFKLRSLSRIACSRERRDKYSRQTS